MTDDYDDLDGLSPANQSYRTCPECGADCPPEPFVTDAGMRIAFSCPEHGVHTVIEPFAD